jgi:TRAP-type mannitol/chloroaromatic compound transport system substrate-binding protein
VQNETVECGHTASYYYIGKDPTFAFDTAVPFGLNTRQHNAWVYHGGGLELMREFYKDYKVTSFLVSHTGAQMGGWFRKEIKTPADMKGIKMRIDGFAGQVMAKLGVVPQQQIADGEIYRSLEKGMIDAAEWVGPYDDQKLGFNKVAPYYYYPGWWEGGPQVSLYTNTKSWDTLPPAYKAVVDAAAAEANGWMLAKYDMLNPPALKRLAAAGVKFRPFSRAVLEACYKSSLEVYADISAKNPRFKKVYDSWKAFRDDQNLWFRFSENTFDNFMGHLSATKKS